MRTLAQLDWGYLTTDGTVGQGIHLGTILTDYRIKITEGLNTFTLTPANSNVSANHIAFDITQDSITIPNKPSSGLSDLFTVKTPGVFASFSIQHRWRATAAEGWVYVTLDGVASAQEQPLPLVVANAIPEPTTLSLAAMFADWGMMRRC